MKKDAIVIAGRFCYQMAVSNAIMVAPSRTLLRAPTVISHHDPLLATRQHIRASTLSAWPFFT